MKRKANLVIAGALLAALLLAVPLAMLSTGLRARPAEPWPESCAAAPPPGRTFHVDPARGDDSADGSAAHPWRSLAALARAGRIGDERLGESRTNRALRLARLRPLIIEPLPNSAPLAGSGDTVLLHDGDHGELDLTRIRNRRWLTIAAAPGARPRLHALRLAGAAGFRLRGLVVEDALGVAARPFLQYLVNVDGADGWPARDIRLEELTIGTASAIHAVPRAEWSAGARNGLFVRGTCIEAVRNRIHDVRFGIAIYQADRVTIADSTITGFSVDGIDFSGDDIAIVGNTIADHRMTGENFHADCMQGQALARDPTYRRIRIERNLCVARTAPPAEPDEILQGISIFDGNWSDVRVRCNLVLASAWHGIALFGVDDAEVSGNVVVGQVPAWESWIVARPSKQGRPPSGNLLRDNIARSYPNATPDRAAPVRAEAKILPNGDAVMVPSQPGETPGVRLERNAIGLPARQPVDPRFTTVALGPTPQLITAEAARTRYPLPATCRAPRR